MPKRYLYAGTNTLKNRLGVQDSDVANELEAASFAEQRKKPVPGFSADMTGLKATHQVLLGKMYEWAGKTRGETVTINGETFTPAEHILTKNETQFGPASVSEMGLPEELAKQRKSLDDLQQRGTLTKAKWAEITANQVGAINHAHPFRDGNGRTMRRFVELSAGQYGFRSRMIGGPEWARASHEAMDFRQTKGLQELIERNTTEKESEPGRAKGGAAKRLKETNMTAPTTHQGETTTARSRKAATATAAASKAVAAIQDPRRRAEAQQLLDNMRKNEANLLKAQRRSIGQDRATNKPEQKAPVVRRNREQDFER